jgi:precorrin-6B methylase 2
MMKRVLLVVAACAVAVGIWLAAQTAKPPLQATAPAPPLGGPEDGPSVGGDPGDVLLAAGAGAQSLPAKKPDVAFIPTPQPVVDAMLELADVKPTDVVYDLGSGDGRIVITAARKYGARGVGIELDPALVKQATQNAAAAGVSDKVQFVTGDIFTANISSATVVTLYLLQSINERLRPKLVRELKPGTRIVSHVFNMGPEWGPERTITLGPNRIFLWSIPVP